MSNEPLLTQETASYLLDELKKDVKECDCDALEKTLRAILSIERTRRQQERDRFRLSVGHDMRRRLGAGLFNTLNKLLAEEVGSDEPMLDAKIYAFNPNGGDKS